MLHRLSRVLREIHRLSREAPVAEFQDAAFEAMKGLIRFDAGYWGGGRRKSPTALPSPRLQCATISPASTPSSAAAREPRWRPCS